MGENGRPAYDQGFFVALARRGKDAWNEWRHKHPDINVTFEGVNFDEPDHIDLDFSGFKFGSDATFSGASFVRGAAKFGGAEFWARANFSGATFGIRSADFSGATFGDEVNFSGATFGDETLFPGAKFGRWANFRFATFDGRTDFSEAHFETGIVAHGPIFIGATLGWGTDFSGATIGTDADFSGATIGHGTNFSGATFDGNVTLDAKSHKECQEQLLAYFSSLSEERKQKLLAAYNASHQREPGPDGFGNVSFAQARFKGVAHFSGRNFLARTDFTRARFDEPPIFDRCQNVGRLDLYGARIEFSGTVLGFTIPGWTIKSDIAIRLRLLRKLAEETKNHDLERDLYIEERKAERGIVLSQYWREGGPVPIKPKFLAHCLWIAVMGGYWLLADYGRSFIRPLLALVASIFVFYGSYSLVLTSSTTAREPKLERATWAFAIANAVPFVGALTLEKEVKGIILCAGAPPGDSTAEESTPTCIPTVALQLLALGQSIISGLLVFFIALALRNFFKLR
jgi:uncharacterized protein YjbI with pentapeptide repeats